ncbi:MAG TPA: hypothetical protein VGO07_00700 [Candidatus Saccharimonadales bacterium]|jgi:hypothetical protein|nr:hypothetical protein [Candidatus Saccharimonadales bacterium]
MSEQIPLNTVNTLPNPGEILPVNQADFHDFIDYSLDQTQENTAYDPDTRVEMVEDLQELQETIGILDDPSLTPGDIISEHKQRMAFAVDGEELKNWTAADIAKFNRKMDHMDRMLASTTREPGMVHELVDEHRADKLARDQETGHDTPLTSDEFKDYVNRYAEDAKEFPDFEDPQGDKDRAKTMEDFQTFLQQPENEQLSPDEAVDNFLADFAKTAPTTAPKEAWAARTKQRAMMLWLKKSSNLYPGSIREDNTYWQEVSAGAEIQEDTPTPTEAAVGTVATETTVERPAGYDVVAQGRAALDRLNVSSGTSRSQEHTPRHAAPEEAEYTGMPQDQVEKARADIDELFARSRANAERTKAAEPAKPAETTADNPETEQELAWRKKGEELAAAAMTPEEHDRLEALRSATVEAARSRPAKDDEAGWQRKNAAVDEYRRLSNILGGSNLQSDSAEEFLGILKHVGLPAEEYNKIADSTRRAFGQGRRKTSISYSVLRKPDGSFDSNMVGLLQTKD